MANGNFQQEMNTKKIHISELQIGMYVSKLDREWIDTPFLMQGFLVENLDDIETICEYCEHVWIDALVDRWVPHHERSAPTPSSSKKRYIHKVPLQAEHRKAIGAYSEARRLTKSFLDEARLGGVIDTKKAKATVQECVKSVVRNPEALMWMSRMRDQDEYTAEHCLNVCILAICLGRHLEMDEEDLNKLGICGLLHDVGKMSVPEEILNKPGKLTEHEFKIMKAHTTQGRNLLMSSPGIYRGAVDVAYSHHERLDGLGYPRGIKANGLSDFNRIVSIVDTYDAVTATRCYASAKTSTDALKILHDNRGTHFDPRLVNAFIDAIGLYPPGSIVELVNGQVGLVLSKNHRYRQLPKVIMLLGSDKKPTKQTVVNLANVEKKKLGRDYLIKTMLVDGSYDIHLKDYRELGLQFG